MILLLAVALGTWTDRYERPLRVEGPTPVRLEEVSPWAVLSTLAAEDKRFFKHGGVDPRAVARALWTGHGGASTISQQLARAIKPRPRTLSGKLAEAWQALSLERRMGKGEILEAYMGTVSYGGRVTGIEDAARSYFGVPARDLTLAQAALLAGLPQAPTRYDPRKRLPAARARQRRVLERLLLWGWIDAAAHAAALSEPLNVLPYKPVYEAPELIAAARGLGGGATTIDAELQAELEDLVRSHLKALRAHNVGSASLVVLDNAGGEALAYIGDPRALRQPGSALKPFVYAEAFSRGLRPTELLEDAPVMFADGFAPRNYDETFHGLVPARQALACSYNVPAALVAARVPALEVLHRFGFASLDKPASHYGLGLALGNGEVTLLELAAAYAALARGGAWQSPRLVLGQSATARRALDRESAYLVLRALSDNAARAPAFGFNSPLHLPFPFAAKTGTTKDYRDNWAAGVTPEWTVAVWVGNNDGAPMRRVSGITGAAPLLRDAALAVWRRRPSSDFARPAGVRPARVCVESGLPPAPDCPHVVEEEHDVRHMPQGRCPGHARAEAAPRPFPRDGDVFKLDPAVTRESQRVLLSGPGPWTVDGKRLSSPWWTLEPGRHVVQGAHIFVAP